MRSMLAYLKGVKGLIEYVASAQLSSTSQDERRL